MSLLEMKHFLWSVGAPGSVWHVICLLTPWGSLGKSSGLLCLL